MVNDVLSLFKAATAPPTLKGKLYLSKSGFLLLAVPNAIGRGAFNALSQAGIELPPSSDGQYNAHITVMRPEDIAKIGGPDKITERGRDFGYTLGKIKDFNPAGWAEMNRCWVIEARSPELETLRRTYGLSSLPVHSSTGQPMQFHITFAVRRNGVLGENTASKATASAKQSHKPKGFAWDKPGTQVVKVAAAPRVRVAMPYGDNEYLLERMNNPKYPQNLGRVRFPGGGVEEGETPEQAAVRELFEELGIAVRPDQFSNLGVHDNNTYLQLNEHGLTPGNYNATVGGDKVIELLSGKPEGDKYWGPALSELKQAAATCPACGGAIVEVRGHTECSQCRRICESCCEGRKLSEIDPHISEKTAAIDLSKLIARAALKAVKPKSEAQAEAGNYQKGHLSWKGLRISIECRKGQKRKPEWKAMTCPYGYFRGTEGKDGDHVDVFIGPQPDAELVFVIDQIDPKNKNFDEHKVVIGCAAKEEAKALYMSNYEDNWQGFGKITPLTVSQFKEWLDAGSQTRPISTQTFKLKKTAKDEEDNDDAPGILVIQKSTTIRMIVPDKQPRDDDGKFADKSDLPKRLYDDFERLLEQFNLKDERTNGKKI